MLTASFPPSNWGWMAWFALVPLLKSLENEPPSAIFRLGFIAGLAHFLTLIYWILQVLGTYGGLNIVISGGLLLLLCIYLAVYPGIFTVLFSRLRGTVFPALTAGALWVSLEFIRAKFLTGFPWCLLGYSQHSHPALIQSADTLGVYGLSFLILAVNTMIYLLFFNGGPSPGKRLVGMETSVIGILILLLITYGYYRISEYDTKSTGKKSVRVAIIQGNIDQSVKWNPAFQKKTLEKYIRLSRSAYAYHPYLIIWPETAIPAFFQDGDEITKEVFKIPLESGAYLIFGSPAYKIDNGAVSYYNRMYVLSPQGIVTGWYDKVHLVPFGEYVPMKNILPFVHRLVPAAGDFASGKEVKPLELRDFSVGGLICYEAIFPELSRSHSKKGAKILVNLTNDAWFGMTSAPYQHLIMSIFRAVETRMPLIRAANTGFSAVIDPRGDIVARGDLFNEEVLTAEVPIGKNHLTFYSKYGDLFAYLLFVICLIKLFYELCYHRFKRRK